MTRASTGAAVTSWLRRASIAAIALGLLAAAFIGGHSAWLAHQSLHPARGPAPTDVPGESVTFRGANGVSLAGSWLPSRNGAALVLAHGLGADRRQLLAEASLLADRGYGVLLFDERDHGSSGGTISTWGDLEQADVGQAVNLVVSRPGVDPTRIGALGFSIGGAAVALTAATDSRIRAVAIEATFASLEDDYRYTFGRYGALSALPALWTLRLEGVDVAAVRPVDALCAISPRPLLLVYGTHDPGEPPTLGDRMRAAACGPASLVMIDTHRHGDYATDAPAQYEPALTRFFDTALARGG